MIGRIVLGAAVAFVAASVVASGSASAGGFSTVGLTSPPPSDVAAGQAWEARFTVLAHGRTPLENLEPVVRIERADGDGARVFRATETDARGSYRARVIFPADGRWSVEVAEHGSMAGTPVAGHRFGVVDVGASASGSEAAWGGGLGSLVSSIAGAVEVGIAVLSILVAADGGGGADHGAAPTGDAGWADEGRRVFAALGCGSCHRLAAAGSTGGIGPDLDERLAGHDRASLIRSIVDAPDRGLSAMPADYRERMTDAELDALVSFLLASK